MPLAPLLRTGLLLSSLTVAASYTLYETNPTFRAFVDKTLDQISTLWSDVLAALSPEERQRQRDRQRHVFLGELSARGVAGAREAAAAVVPEAAQSSGADSHGTEARARRRRLWEMAEDNARQIRERAVRANRVESRVTDLKRDQDEGKRDSMYSQGQASETLFSAYESGSAGPAAAAAGTVLVAEPTAETALHSHPNEEQRSRTSSLMSAQADDPEIMTPFTDAGLDVSTDGEASTYFDDAASAITASTERYSHILTPTSPSLRSVSDDDASELQEIDPMEYTHTDLGVEYVGDPPVSGLDELEDPDIDDIGAFVQGATTPSTMSVSMSDVDADEVMSVHSAFSETGWTEGSVSDAGNDVQDVRHRL